MPKVSLTTTLTTEYQTLFDACQITPARAADVDAIAKKIEDQKPRYLTVGQGSIPWYFIGAVHSLESSLSFSRHLHNGDPLTKRTVQVPAGRPLTGNPPFTWEESAEDALSMKNLYAWTDWSIPGLLYKLEEYNGFGYRQYHPSVKSPYLWSFTNQYDSGRYVADGTWSPTARSSQCGAAAILRRLAEWQSISFDNAGLPLGDAAGVTSMKPLVEYRPATYSENAEKLQSSLNGFPGIFLKTDGKAGKRTSDALKKVVGSYLAGDPRNDE
jgi:lysozyme family protein